MLALCLLLSALSTEELLEPLGAPEHDRGILLSALAEKIGATEAPLENPEALGKLFAQLAAIERGEGERPVRIVHLGDSQIASDYITDVVRRRLQLRYGSGGRGFLFIDKTMAAISRTHRNGIASVGWSVKKIPEPKITDKIYGFTGVNFIGKDTSVEYSLTDTRTAELFYLATPKGGTIEAMVDDELAAEISLRADVNHGGADPIPLLPDSKKLVLNAKGHARLFGVALENGNPGIVYDAIGVPGANFSYFMKTDEAAFIDQLARREPSVVILQLAGAEVYDMTRGWTTPQKSAQLATDLIARVKAAAPEAECLLMGPLSRGNGETQEPRKETGPIDGAMREVATSNGCAYWSALDAMGGVPAAVKWAKHGAMNRDLVHPKGDGADLVGQLFELAIVRAYSETAPARPRLSLGLEGASALQRTFGKLHKLQNGEVERVAIVHLGASHTAAQLFTDEARSRLVERFGDAGRGFIDVGGGKGPIIRAKMQRKKQGSWQVYNFLRKHPGLFGLTGLRVELDPGANVTLDFCKGCTKTKTKAKIDLFYLDDQTLAPFDILLDGKTVSHVQQAEAEPRAKVLSFDVKGIEHTLTVKNVGTSKIALLGAAIERDKPGIVYDALGLPGATAFVADGFDKPSFTAQLETRRADLYVLFYGTNEASIRDFSPDEYKAAYLSFLSTIRAASPEAECLIMSGSDRMSPAGGGKWAVAPAQAQVSQALREVAAAAGCAFWHTIDNMGGTGSADKWARLESPLARRDRVHLTESGYRGLARRLIKDLLDAYGKTDWPP